MTPLAHALQRQLLRPARERARFWQNPEAASKLQRHLAAAKGFEVTAAWPLVEELRSRIRGPGDWASVAPMVFLPAPQVWIETAVSVAQDRGRVAFLLETRADGVVDVHYIEEEAGAHAVGVLREADHSAAIASNADLPDQECRQVLSWVSAVLVVINSPRVVVPHTRTPHRGLAREMRHHGLSPPGGWCEVRLQVTKPRHIDDGKPHADQVTGQRALHFVRRFIRIRLGQLEYVTAHWRGNPEAGTRHSHYRVSV